MSDPDAEGRADRGELSPSEAFALLAHETRIAALQALWEADEPLRFTDLAERAGITDTGNLNYHLGELDGRFLRREDEQYALTYSGRQAMTAVLTGDFTDQPTLPPTRLDRPCPYCGADIALAHYGDELRVLCTACDGTFRTDEAGGPSDGPPTRGTITTLPFPAAGVRDRPPLSLLKAGLTRVSSRWRDVINGLCPDCGGTTESTGFVCPEHDADGICRACGSRFAGTRTVTCNICGQRHNGNFPLNAVAVPATVEVFLDHGVDLLDPTWEAARHLLQCEERVHSTDPIETEVVWRVDDHSLRMRIGANGKVLDVSHGG